MPRFLPRCGSGGPGRFSPASPWALRREQHELSGAREAGAHRQGLPLRVRRCLPPAAMSDKRTERTHGSQGRQAARASTEGAGRGAVSGSREGRTANARRGTAAPAGEGRSTVPSTERPAGPQTPGPGAPSDSAWDSGTTRRRWGTPQGSVTPSSSLTGKAAEQGAGASAVTVPFCRFLGLKTDPGLRSKQNLMKPRGRGLFLPATQGEMQTQTQRWILPAERASPRS